jgi:hypothetical protein
MRSRLDRPILERNDRGSRILYAANFFVDFFRAENLKVR